MTQDDPMPDNAMPDNDDRTDRAGEEPAVMLTRVAALYESLLEQFGTTHRGIGWSKPEMMSMPYALFGELFADDPGPFSVNDLGCGFGGFFDYLKALPSFRDGRYLGYDISEMMVTTAKTRVWDPRARFVQSAVPLARADYTVASGIFNIRFGASLADWVRHVHDSLDRIAEASVKGFAFNLLGPDPVKRDDDLYYADPAEYLELCSARFSPSVRLIDGYVQNQWMMLVRLGEAG